MDVYHAIMVANRRSLFLFLMELAWRCRYSMPLLLSGTVALLGQAWMFQIRVHTVRNLQESDVHLHLNYYDEEEEQAPDSESWETDSTNSWETIVEEVAYG
ncbi:hypothetical protein EVAR_45509_1 [Eumeta japonica]|uniref:Uncharacterized protein n=1 Tax=Eumeta variegata TaxID=151549 RepID=A0A4C1WEM9_EUMVA|nr:hypothetical protein EVAR_45509_1 [Eumeta japonica]